MKQTILWLVLMFVGVQTLSAQSAKFRASTDAKQIVVNGVFEVRYSLQNGEGRDFQAPEFGTFEVISGPSLSMSTTIVNGNRSQSRSYSYTLMATKPGKYTIPGARIRSGTTLMESNVLIIEIVEGKQNAAADGQTMPTDEQVFVRLEVDSNSIYPGQQIRLDYKLYSTVNIRNYNTLKEDRYEDFFFRYVKNFNERPYLEVIDGIQYRVQTLKSLALFPQKTGTFKIEPLMINVGIGVRDEGRSFFFNTRTIPKTLISNDLSVEVKSLPEPQPEAFTGAIGNYEMAAQVNRRELTTDDALVLTVQIVGNGDAKRWSPPSLGYLADRFEMYDPKILQDKFVDAGGYMQNTKTIEYLLIPQQTGRQQLYVDFTYFNVDSNAYQTLRSRTVILNVKPGSGKPDGSTLLADEMPQKELFGLQSAKHLKKGKSAFLFSPIYGILAAMPFIALLGAIIIKRRREEFSGLDPSERKRMQAMRTALKHLEQAKGLIQGESKAFYEAISLALFGYVSSKLSIPVSELTKHNVEQSMETAGIDVSGRNAVMRMIQRCEMVLYAAGTSGSEHQATYDETLDLVTSIERMLS